MTFLSFARQHNTVGSATVHVAWKFYRIQYEKLECEHRITSRTDTKGKFMCKKLIDSMNNNFGTKVSAMV